MTTEKEIDHSNTDEVVCPYCGYESSDSSEYYLDSYAKKIHCYECNNDFEAEAEYSVSYNTYKIKCKDKHDFSFKDTHISMTEYKKIDGFYKDIDLPELEWKYKEIFKCNKCDEEEYREISKEDFIKKHYEYYKKWREYYYKNKGISLEEKN
jgi:transcription elongation factor Elf1